MSSRQFRDAVHRVRSQLTPPERPVQRPALIILSGLPGTGKSTLAQNLSTALPAIVIQSDLVRTILFPQPTFSDAENRRIHAVARALMRHFLKAGHFVIADSTNLIERHRQTLLQLAKSAAVPALIVQTSAPAEVVKRRLSRRFTRRVAYDLSTADWQVYLLLSATVEPIGVPHLRVDTTRDLESAVQRIVRAVRRTSRTPV